MGKRGGGGSGTQASNAREMRLFLSHRMWREHWYVLAGAAAIVAALFASAFLQFAGSSERMHRVQESDAALVARVFRSGEPWVVLCSRPDDVVPEVVDELPKRLRGRTSIGVMDCAQPLVSTGKSVFATYGIKKSVIPTVFTVANGDRPKQIFQGDLQSTRALAKRVLAQTKKTHVQVRSSAQLASRCLDRDACVLVLRGQRFEPYENQWIKQLMYKHRAVAFVWADARDVKLSIEAALPKVGAGEHRLVLFRREGDAEKKTRLTVRAYRNVVFDAMPVDMFLEENLATGVALKPLAKNPTLKKRQRSAASSDSRPRRPRRQARQGDGNEPEEENEREDGGGGQEEESEGHYDDQEEEEEEVLDLDDE